MPKSALDKDLKKVVRIEAATYARSRSLATPGLLVVFLIGAVAVASLQVTGGPLSHFVFIAAVVAAYMALNIGANDVANNMGPAVGSRALTMASALALAAVCEMSGAMLAGGDVVNTVSKSLLHPREDIQALQFIFVMTAALLSAAMWIHLATFLGAPVSTTHAIVGGVVGAGIAASGVGAVEWPVIGAVVVSWVISPIIGGIIAAALLGFIKWQIIYREDRIAAARRWVPALVALMAGVFAIYLTTKGLKHIWHPPGYLVLLIGAAVFFLSMFAARPWVQRRSQNMENRRKHIAGLFTLPLIFATGLLSFAHGANDVANAVGPLAGIVAAAQTGLANTGQVGLPMWVMAIGAVGIALGLSLFGPGLIRTVGQKITKMDTIRAYCVALSAAITVLIASNSRPAGILDPHRHRRRVRRRLPARIHHQYRRAQSGRASAHAVSGTVAPERNAGTGAGQLSEAREAQTRPPTTRARHRRRLGRHRAGGGGAGRRALLADGRRRGVSFRVDALAQSYR